MANLTVSEMKAHLVARANESEDFRKRLVADPKSVISAEFGVSIPEGFNVQVHEDSATTAHMALPMTDRISEEELAEIAAGVQIYRI